MSNLDHFFAHKVQNLLLRGSRHFVEVQQGLQSHLMDLHHLIRLLSLGTLDDFPLTVLLDKGKLMIAHHIYDF
ncbi:MAG: hypothetical protein ACYSYM_16120 [Planctomycetota bacterium]